MGAYIPRVKPEGRLRRDLPGEGQGGGSGDAPQANTEAMQAHLAEISAVVDPGAHAVLMLDQAGWRMSTQLVIPENITLLPLPPRSPELNPAENIWRRMRENWLSNRVFEDYDDILAHCCDAWNKLVAQPTRIASIGCRAWAHGF
jgi:DDE superfamily endonuclease